MNYKKEKERERERAFHCKRGNFNKMSTVNLKPEKDDSQTKQQKMMIEINIIL